MYSFSRIQTFNQCQRKFKYSYIDKLSTKFNPAFAKGKAIHSILESWGLENPRESRDEENIEKTQKHFDIVDNFINSTLGKDVMSKKSAREVEFFLDKDLNPCEKEDANFVGYIDRVNFFENAVDLTPKVELIDFKTGKYKDLKWQDFTQLMIYSIYIFKKYNKIDKIKLRFVYVEHNLENDLILERDAIKEVEKKLLNDINEIEELTKDFLISNNENIFKKNITKLCDYCDFKEICLQN